MHWICWPNSMRLLTKFNEFAKQRTILLTVMHLQGPCFAGRETAMAILHIGTWKRCRSGFSVATRSAKRWRLGMRVSRYFFSCRKSLLVVSWWSNEGLLWSVDGLFVVETWSKRVKIKSSATGYVSVSLLVRQCLWSGGRFLRHRVCACAHAHAQGVWG